MTWRGVAEDRELAGGHVGAQGGELGAQQAHLGGGWMRDNKRATDFFDCFCPARIGAEDAFENGQG